MRIILLIFIGLVCLGPSCAQNRSETGAKTGDPLADSLLAIFERLQQAAIEEKTDEFVSILDPQEITRLQIATEGYGFHSLKSYLERQFATWPDPDTLRLADLVYRPPYARLSFTGNSNALGRRDPAVRYTFLLFRLGDDGWQLAGMSNLDKARFDEYGTEQSYLETELPPRLRFPRLF